MPRAAFALMLALVAAAPAVAQKERPKRRPAEGGYLGVRLTILHSELDGIATDDTNGSVWFVPTTGKDFEGGADLAVATGSGDVDLPDFDIKLDADYDAFGAEEPANGPLDTDLVLRALSSSDLSLIPIRLLIPHRMTYDGNSREATKEIQCTGATVEMGETKLGTRRFEGIPHDVYFTTIVRRFQPSGYQIHDYVVTAEDKDEGYVMAGAALRALIHPTLGPDGGRPAEAGVLMIVRADVHQLHWLRDRSLLEQKDQEWVAQKFEQNLMNGLFAAMQREGVGDLFDSPSALTMATVGLLDERNLGRLINIEDPKPLAMIAPQIVDMGLEFDGATHLKLWKEADDPVRRLLLAAGAAAGGKKDPAFKREAKLAVQSSDRSVLRAARVLATALGDAALAAEAANKLGS